MPGGGGIVAGHQPHKLNRFVWLLKACHRHAMNLELNRIILVHAHPYCGGPGRLWIHKGPRAAPRHSHQKDFVLTNLGEAPSQTIEPLRARGDRGGPSGFHLSYSTFISSEGNRYPKETAFSVDSSETTLQHRGLCVVIRNA